MKNNKIKESEWKIKENKEKENENKLKGWSVFDQLEELLKNEEKKWNKDLFK